MNSIRTDFIKEDRFGRSGFPARLKNQEVVRDYPRSEQVRGECPHCGYEGRAAVYYGWNSYWSCPECGEECMTSG